MNWIDSRLYRYQKWRKWRGLPEPRSPKSDEITREALAILFKAANFSFETVNREYETEWSSIKVRKPTRQEK